MKPETIKIDEIEYVRKDSVSTQAVSTEGLSYVIVRGDRSGIFAGFLKDRIGTEVELLECRRLWYWDGAASISQIANDGVSKPDNCKFPKSVKTQLVLDAIEVIPATQKALESIKGVKVWEK